MAEIERVCTIPLRREFLKVPRSKRSNCALRTVENFVRKHTKAKEIKISKGINELIFSHGFQKPPAKIRVEVKGSEEMVDVKLPGEVIVRKEEKKKGIAGLKERLTGKEKETGEKEPREKTKEEARQEEKLEETKEEKPKEEKETGKEGGKAKE